MTTRIPVVVKTQVRKCLVKRSEPDKRDHHVMVINPKLQTPSSINLSTRLPFVFDQGSIGSCTANSAGYMYSWFNQQKNKQLFIPSRLYLYYNTRVLEGTVSYDSGATLRNTLKSLQKSGVCSESSWSYFSTNLFKKPSTICYTEGSNRQALSYASVPISLVAMKNILQTRPFVIGIMVYSSFFIPSVAKNGIVPTPNTIKEKLLGGHAIIVIGYDDSKQAFLCRNSWGKNWGLNGDFYLPYQYVTNPRLAFDAWVLYNAEAPIANIRVRK